MRLLVLITIPLLLAVSIVRYAGFDVGQMTITVAGWVIQTSFGLFVISIIVLFLLIYFLLRLCSRFWNMFGKLNSWKKNRHQRLSENFLSRGLTALVKGNWNQAEVFLSKGVPHSQSPLLHYLAAARAAQKLAAVDRRDNYLMQAYKNNPSAELTIGLVQAELQLNQHQAKEALATLTHLHEQNPKQEQVKKMLLQTYVMLGNWEAILELLPKIKPAMGVSKEEIQAKLREAYGGLLKQAGLNIDKENLNSVWLNIPRKLRTEPYLIEVYAEEKLKLADASDCEPLLYKALKKHPHISLLGLYGLIEGKDAAKQLKFAESLLVGHAMEPVLLLTLARLSIKNKLWGKARVYLNKSIEIHPQPEAYRILARVLEELGESEAVTAQYQKGLELATTELADAGVKLLGQSEETQNNTSTHQKNLKTAPFFR